MPYSKLEDLLLLLASRHPRPLDREEVSDILWPHADDIQRKVNMRQAIYRLRRIFGGDSIQADAKKCGFLGSFPFEIEKGILEGSSDKTVSDPCAIEGGPVDSFVQMLRWFAEWDPGQMLDLMRSNRDITFGIWPQDLQQLIRSANRRLPLAHPLAGWVSFWLGCCLLEKHQIPGSISLFETAYELGSTSNERVLMVEALFYCGICAILLRRLDGARQIARRLSAIVRGTSDNWLRLKSRDLDGTILIHMGRTQEGLATLEMAHSAISDRVLECAQNQALRALYLACAGKLSESERQLRMPIHLAEETRHFRLESICTLANGYLALGEGDKDGAFSLLEDLSRRSSDKSRHYEIYAREGAAVALIQMKEVEESKKQMASAIELRKSLNMAYTEWDRLRLRPLRSA